MLRQFAVIAGLGMMLCAVPTAIAQEVDAALLDQGAQLYQEQCAACHQEAGGGLLPQFPKLAGNPNLADLTKIVTNIHNGKEAMPPFPHLTAEQIAALATYIRNSWGNALGAVTVAEVEAILGGTAPVAGDDAAAAPEVASLSGRTIWDGVFTAEQALRGEQINSGACASCHGRRMDGAALDPDRPSTPPIARDRFLRKWDGQSVAGLFALAKATMPKNNPGGLSDQQYVDMIAYMISFSGAPAGDTELPADPAGLAGVAITQKRD